MSVKLSRRATSIAPSATLAVNAKASQMKAQGIDVVNFGVGEPDFATPKHIGDKGIEAIQRGFTKYTPGAGTAEIRRAIVAKLARDNDVTYLPKETIACVGAKQAIFLALQVLVDPGDEVLIPSPYWVSYPEMVSLSDGVSIFVEVRLEDDFKLTPAALEKACTRKSKVLVLNYPNNPTGASFTRAELDAIVDVCIRKGIYIISDEVYEKLLYDGDEHVSVAALSPEAKAITVTTNGVSKAYAMTGWRLGYAAGPSEVIAAMIEIQGHMNTNTSSISQYASVEALMGPQDTVAEMAKEFKRRRDYMFDRISAMPHLIVRKPPGAFYLFPDVSGVFGREIRGHKIASDMDFVDVVLSEGHTALVPGRAFGNPNCVRLSYATSLETIAKGMDRMEALLREAK
jgi:aspartate aminotransferase